MLRPAARHGCPVLSDPAADLPWAVYQRWNIARPWVVKSDGRKLCGDSVFHGFASKREADQYVCGAQSWLAARRAEEALEPQAPEAPANDLSPRNQEEPEFEP